MSQTFNKVEKNEQSICDQAERLTKVSSGDQINMPLSLKQSR